jgi:TusA-related sulfurtransferase
MKSFKIYTENLNENKIKELLSISFDGFTIIHTKGTWKRIEENAIIIEILTDNETLVKAIAKVIKGFNKQEAVLVTSHAVDCELI